MFSNITKNCTPKTNCYVQNVLLAILKESDFSFSEVVAHIHKVCRKTQKINTKTPHQEPPTMSDQNQSGQPSTLSEALSNTALFNTIYCTLQVKQLHE